MVFSFFFCIFVAKLENMKKLVLPLLLAIAVISAYAETKQVSSPDGKLNVSVNLNSGKASYYVSYNGNSVLRDSPLGFVASMGDFNTELKLVKSTTSKRHLDYTMDRSKQSHVVKDVNELVVTFENNQKRQFDVRFCVGNNDIAFRYEMGRVPDKTYENKSSIRIMNEKTGFRFPENTTTFLTPQSLPMIGWKGTKPSYEEDYVYDDRMINASKFSEGYTFPCLFKIPGSKQVVQTGKKKKNQATIINNVWVLISETGVDSRYCGSHLSGYHGNGLYSIAFPLPGENNGNGTVEPAFALPGHTPWRTITVGTSLQPIVETTVPWDFVEPLYEPSQKYEYGKGTWSWIVWQDGSINYDDQVKFIDLANAMGYKYALVDNWWDTKIGKERMEELAKYAKSKNVDLFVWHSSSGYWNDVIQGPVNMMDNTIERKKEMAWLKKIGAKGIKVDFFGGDKQETMRLYEDILSDANDYGLMVIFHGCTLPRGWERMYPNYVGSEAVLASENLIFDQKYCNIEAQNTSTHPFIRNTVGCMEFGGSFMNTKLGKDNKKGTTRRTTYVHELAQAVLFQNPVQNFAITPENLGMGGTTSTPAPKLCMDFLKDVPTEWDEVRYIAGYPGKSCILARRHGSTWYIAGSNATGQKQELTLSLSMLKEGAEASFYMDNIKNGNPILKRQKISNNGKIKITVPNNGGFVIVQ